MLERVRAKWNNWSSNWRW